MNTRAVLDPSRLDGLQIFAFPYYRNNPWQAILHDAATSAGVRVRTFESTEGFIIALHECATLSNVVLHLNWTAPIAQVQPDVLSAMLEVRRFLDVIDISLERGARVLWTVHNELPHELRYFLPELRLVQGLADRASRIMILNQRTASAVRDRYELDSRKLVELAHPSYLGRYADDTSRDVAREHFRYGPDDRVLLALGVVRPYKNIGLLVRAFREISARAPNLRLLIGGELGIGSNEAELRRLIGEDPHIHAELRFVPDAELQIWFAAADVSVYAFEQILNSGSLMLSATFGTPAIVSDLPAMEGLMNEPWVLPLSMPVTVVTLAGAIERSLRLSSAELLRMSGAASRFAAARHPDSIAAQFVDLLAALRRGQDEF